MTPQPDRAPLGWMVLRFFVLWIGCSVAVVLLSFLVGRVAPDSGIFIVVDAATALVVGRLTARRIGRRLRSGEMVRFAVATWVVGLAGGVVLGLALLWLAGQPISLEAVSGLDQQVGGGAISGWILLPLSLALGVVLHTILIVVFLGLGARSETTVQALLASHDP